MALDRRGAARGAVATTLMVALLHAGLPVPEGSAPIEQVGPLSVANPLLADALRSVERRSPTWRAGLDSLAATGFEVLVGEPGQVGVLVPALARYEPQHLGEVIPLRRSDGVMYGVLVTVDVPKLREMAARMGQPARVVEADAALILVHEIYGHVVPLSRTRALADGCPDPAPAEPALSSCAIVRENRIRAELGLPARDSYDLRALTLGKLLTGG